MVSPEFKGRMYRRLADTITYGRTVVGAVLAANIVSGDEILPAEFDTNTWSMFGVVGVMGALDKADGYFARKAEALGVEITEADKKKDPKQDKIFAYTMMGSIATRSFIDRKPIISAGISANLAVTMWRDRKMNKSRDNAVEGADVGAIGVNKYKTGVQNLAHSMAVSPLAESLAGQIATVTTYSTSTIMGLFGLRKADKIHKGLT